MLASFSVTNCGTLQEHENHEQVIKEHEDEIKILALTDRIAALEAKLARPS